MSTKFVEKELKVISIHAVGDMISIRFSPVRPVQVTTPRLADVIKKEYETEEEVMAMRMVRVSMKEFTKVMRPRMTVHQSQAVTISLTQKEYEELGKPTVNECLTLKLEFEQ